MTLLLFPAPGPDAVVRALDLKSVAWKAAKDLTNATNLEPDGGWAGAVLAIDRDVEEAVAIARWLKESNPSRPVLVLTPADRLILLGGVVDCFDDFCLMPFHPAELEARLDHMLVRLAGPANDHVIEYGPLSLNVETYQAVIEGRTLDLTYMEYELLRYLASEPGKVFSREKLLTDVWGYDYYGGARTVDVHIRRLRAKFGEEHASMISTVRSVGYRLGQAR